MREGGSEKVEISADIGIIDLEVKIFFFFILDYTFISGFCIIILLLQTASFHTHLVSFFFFKESKYCKESWSRRVKSEK